MKDIRNYIILALVIVVIYFALSGRHNVVDQEKINSLENEKKVAVENLFTLKKKTVADSLSFREHLQQDSLNSIDKTRLETSLTKSRQDYKEALNRNKAVFTYEQRQLDSVFQALYPKHD